MLHFLNSLVVGGVWNTWKTSPVPVMCPRRQSSACAPEHVHECTHTPSDNYKFLNCVKVTIHEEVRTQKYPWKIIIRELFFETGGTWNKAWKVARIWIGWKESGRIFSGNTRKICSDHLESSMVNLLEREELPKELFLPLIRV